MKSLFNIAFGLLLLVFGILSIAQAHSAQDQSAQPAQPQTAPASPPQTAPSTPAESGPASSQKEQSPPEKQNSDSTTDPNAPRLQRKSARKPTHRKSRTHSGKVVVRNGGVKEGTPELAPGLSKEQALHNRDNTNQLLSTTDANLKKISGRQLTAAQQGMLEQIHTYVAQSKTASNAGDLNRAHTLAFKAHLLSDELAKK